jgi:hypothetical protein
MLIFLTIQGFHCMHLPLQYVISLAADLQIIQ